MPAGRAGPEGPPPGVLARVTGARVARLATLGEAGPRLVPVTFAWHEGALVWAVDTAKPKRTRDLRRLRDIARDPRVALLVDHYEEDWSALWWVEVVGRAELLEGAAAERALDALAARYPAYRRARPPGVVVAVRPERWTWWAASEGGFEV